MHREYGVSVPNIAFLIIPLFVIAAVVVVVILLLKSKNIGGQTGNNSANCPVCGTPVAEGRTFCAVCGKGVTPNNAQSEQQPVYQPHIGGYRAPISKRELVTCLLLSIVTCGIYGIVWMINLVDDLNTASQSHGDQNGVTVFLLSLVTCGIYSYVWLYKAGEKVNLIRRLNGEAPDTNASLIYLLLGFFGFGIVADYLIQEQLNKVAAN